MKVVIWHNTARKCRSCGEPLMLRDGTWETTAPSDDPSWCTETEDAGRRHADMFSAWEDGYQPGDPMVRVFETEYGRTGPVPKGGPGLRFYFPGDPIGQHLGPGVPEMIAAAFLRICNRWPGSVATERETGERYFERLRNVQPGDVIQAGEDGDGAVLFAVGRDKSLSRVNWPLNESTVPEPGTIPLKVLT